MQIWKSSKVGRTITVLLLDRFSNHCLANAIEPFRAANTLSGHHLYSWKFLGLEVGPVESSSGLAVTPERVLERHDGGDLLFVLPSYGFRRFATPATLRTLRAASRRFRRIVGMDTGAWLLAEAGLLQGRRATIHWDEFAAFEEAFPEVTVRPESFVLDGPVITCGGASTTFDLALHLIEVDHGPMLRLEVAALFVHGARDRGAFATRAEIDDDRIHAAIGLMRRHLEEPPKLGRIARETGLTLRALETLFTTRLGHTPRQVWKALRLREARRLVEQTRMSIAEVATRCGYSDPTAFTRAFSAEFGAPPSRLRPSPRPA